MKITILDIIHILLIMAAISTGFFFPAPIIILLIIVHRLHVWLFGGCAVSLLQSRLGKIHPSENFLQHLGRNIFNLKLSDNASVIFDYAISLMPLGIVLIRK